MSGFFLEFTLVFLFIFFISYILSIFKQPIMIGYIIGGIFLGPIFFDVLSTSGYYQVFSHIGIAFLLFLVGLHLNIKLIKDVGIPAILTGIGQILLTILISIIFTLTIGFSLTTSIIIAISLSFSSTIVIVKLLSDKNALETLSGKISLAFLLVQDCIAVIVLLGINTYISLNKETETIGIIFNLFLTILIAVILFVVTKPILKLLFQKNHNSEMLFLFAIAWCFSISSLFNYLGFSLEIGAILAGTALASTPLHYEISARIKPLRDFFIILFFIVLGSQMFASSIDFSQINSFSEKFGLVQNEIINILPISIVLSLIVLIGNPLIVFIILSFLKYTPRVSFNCGLAVSQISEFSLIIVLLAYDNNLIKSNIISILTLVMLITILFSSYMFFHSEQLFRLFKPLLLKINKHKYNHDEILSSGIEIIISGFSSNQKHHLEKLNEDLKKYVIIENSEKNYKMLKKKNIPSIFGDISNIEFLNEFNLTKLKAFISLKSDLETSFMILESIKKVNETCVIILMGNNEEEAFELYSKGATFVIIPEHIQHEKVFSIVNNLFQDLNNKERIKNEHIKMLRTIKE